MNIILKTLIKNIFIILFLLIFSPSFVFALQPCGITINKTSFTPTETIDITLTNFLSSYLSVNPFVQLNNSGGIQAVAIPITNANYNQIIKIKISDYASISDGIYALWVKAPVNVNYCSNYILNICISATGACTAPTSTSTYKTKDCDFCGMCTVVDPLVPPPGNITTSAPPRYDECKKCLDGDFFPTKAPSIKEYGTFTALGCIPSSPDSFVVWFLEKMIYIIGGIAFLVMLYGVLIIMLSAGNPEKLNEGKDFLTSAIVGLVFIIFAILLLKIIGIDILGIPDFSL